MADQPVDHNKLIRPDHFTEDEPETFMKFYLPPGNGNEEDEDEDWDDDDPADELEEEEPDTTQHTEGDAPCAPFRVEQLSEEHEGLESVAGRHQGIGSTGPLKVKAYRAGKLEDHHGRGIFFGHSHESVHGYSTPEHPVQEHSLHVHNALHAPGHDELHKHLYKGKSFWTAIDHEDHKLMQKPGAGEGTLHQAQRRVEARMAAKVHSMGHDAILYTKPSYLKAGKKPGPELALIGHSANKLASQHSEMQFAEEPTHIKQLREFIQKGTSTKILETIKKIKALKSAGSVGIQTMAGLIEKEIRALQPLLAKDLAVGMYGAAIHGVKEAVQELPEQATQQTTQEALPASGAASPDIELVLPENVVLPALDDALDVLRASPAAAGVDYKQTAEMVRQGAFAITADLTDNAVGQVRDILADSLRDGTILPDFIDQVAEKLGTGTLADHHVENIFRTNTMAAFSAGQARAITNPLVSDHFPYALYSATRDARVREEHMALEKLGLNGTAIYRVDDPTFQKFRPPWDYQCRCGWTPQTVEQAARKGVKEAQDWMDRAKKMAIDKGGSFYQYLNAVAPTVPEHVKPPEFEPPPEFKRL